MAMVVTARRMATFSTMLVAVGAMSMKRVLHQDSHGTVHRLLHDTAPAKKHHAVANGTDVLTVWTDEARNFTIEDMTQKALEREACDTEAAENASSQKEAFRLVASGMALGDMAAEASSIGHDNYDISDEESYEKRNVADDDSAGAGNDDFDTAAPTLCEPAVASNMRHMLMMIAFPYHGSTALEGVLLSSKKLATLCSYNKWQCEGKNIMMDSGFSADSLGWKFDKMLELYSDHWDLNRPVLFEKSPLQMMRVKTVLAGLETAEVPQKMQSFGVQHLKYGYLLMWRPICLAHLSSHAQEDIKAVGVEMYAKRELANLAYLVRNHWYLAQNTTQAILVVNLADLIWRPERNKRRLLRFAPCLDDIDVDYVPQMGVDIYPGNMWKAEGSVRAFGRRTNPKGFYDIEEGTCYGDNDLFSVLPPALKARADDLVAYLVAYS